MKTKIFMIITLLMLGSCATQTFSVNPKVKREVPSGNPHFSKWSHFFIQGVGQSSFQNASKLCQYNGGVLFVESKQTVGQVALSAITLGIYTPRTMNIYCKN